MSTLSVCGPPSREAAVACSELPWLGQKGCELTERVGGKAAALSRLASAYRVPPGFCIPASQPSPGVTDTLTAPVSREVLAAYRRLGERLEEGQPAVAVRSSSTDEDGPESSLAGQLLTLLNVRGTVSLLEAISRCRASNRSPEVHAYRHSRGLSPAGPLAVLVQRQIPADISVVAFSIDPVGRNPRHMVLNAHWGLGESLVGGTSDPDHVVVDRSRGEILDYRPGAKRSMTVLRPHGTQEVAVPRMLRHRRVLDPHRVREVTRLVEDLERSEGFPVDVECAFCGGDLFLLQCRPITGLDRALTARSNGG